MATLIDVFRLGDDAVLRYTGNGEPVCNVSLAYAYGQKDSDGKRPTQWIEASLWGERAEKLKEHLTKGREIFAHIEDPHIETYAKKDGGQGVKLVGRCGSIRLVGDSGKRKAEESTTEMPAGDAGNYAQAKGKSAKKLSKKEDVTDGQPF